MHFFNKRKFCHCKWRKTLVNIRNLEMIQPFNINKNNKLLEQRRFSFHQSIVLKTSNTYPNIIFNVLNILHNKQFTTSSFRIVINCLVVLNLVYSLKLWKAGSCMELNLDWLTNLDDARDVNNEQVIYSKSVASF